MNSRRFGHRQLPSERTLLLREAGFSSRSTASASASYEVICASYSRCNRNLRTTVLFKASRGSEHYQVMNCSFANLWLRLEFGELRLLSTDEFARSRSDGRTILRRMGVLLFLRIRAASLSSRALIEKCLAERHQLFAASYPRRLRFKLATIRMELENKSGRLTECIDQLSPIEFPSTLVRSLTGHRSDTLGTPILVWGKRLSLLLSPESRALPAILTQLSTELFLMRQYRPGIQEKMDCACHRFHFSIRS